MILDWQSFQQLKKDNKIRTLNKGSQWLAYLCQSDIVIFVGERGTGKTTVLLYKHLPYLDNPNYNAVIYRKEYGDMEKAGGIVDASKKILGQFGDYLSTSRKWVFSAGGRIDFINYSDPIADFRENVQGKENVISEIDECTHCDELHWGAIMANLRNTNGLKTQMIGTCNPDSSSWIKDLVIRYLDIDTLSHTARHNPHLRGKELYFFQYGNTIKESVWGLTKQEVYENAKNYIDEQWRKMIERKQDLSTYGDILDLILSITVFDSSKVENEALMRNGGIKYQARLLMQSNEMKNRYAISDWENTYDLESLVSKQDLENIYHNSEQRTGTRFASMDVGGLGTDKSIIYIWDGFHIENIYSTKSKSATELLQWIKRILQKENIPLENFVYDAGGLGFALSGSFDGAFQFISQAKQTEILDYDGKPIKIYANFKSQTVGCFLKYLKSSDINGTCAISINPQLLDIDIYGKTLRQCLDEERLAICWTDKKDGILQTINKEETVSLIGHSADIMLALVYRFAFCVNELNNFVEPDEDWLEEMNYYFNTTI